MAYDPAWQHQFLVGERLLVAPVTREEARELEVYLPDGRWLDLATKAVYDGQQVVTVDAPLDRIPMFLRAGGILPMQKAVQYVGEETATPSKLTLEVFPAHGGAFELYEDDGSSFEYWQGTYRTTRFSVSRGVGGFELVRELTHDGWAPGERSLEMRFHAVQEAPDSVSVDGRPLSPLDLEADGEGYFHDSGRGVLTVRVVETGELRSVRVR
jgi:hypothetical protein